MSDQTEQTPTERQRAVIEAVCGLANALLCTWGRGAGATWTRKRIAERILADDAGLDEERAALAALVPVPREYVQDESTCDRRPETSARAMLDERPT